MCNKPKECFIYENKCWWRREFFFSDNKWWINYIETLDTNYHFNNCIDASIVQNNIWMITNDKMDLKFIIFTTAMRILELTRLCTARVIYEKKKKMKKIRSCLTRWRSVFSQLKLIHNFKCSICVRQRIFFCLVGLRRSRDTWER